MQIGTFVMKHFYMSLDFEYNLPLKLAAHPHVFLNITCSSMSLQDAGENGFERVCVEYMEEILVPVAQTHPESHCYCHCLFSVTCC